MKNILIFGMTPNPGGVESVIMNYYRNMDRKKIHVDFLCYTDVVAYSEEIEKNGDKIYRVPSRKRHPFKFYRKMKEIYTNKKYDAIWINVCSLANMQYIRSAKRYGIKTRIVHAHNSKNMEDILRGTLHKINRHIIKHYATDFWSCDMSASKYFYPNKIINSDKHKIIPNAIDIKKYTYNADAREKYRKELGIENEFVIGHVGRLHFQKNQSFLLDIFAEILKKKPNSTLLLVGQGEDEEMLKEKAKNLGIDEKVKFLGVRNDVPKLIHSFDAFVFPSVFEGLSVVLFEIQAAGIPIFTSDCLSENSKINSNFKFISLNSSPSVWADQILKTTFEDRIEQAKPIRESKYNIDLQIKEFEKLFE